MKRIIAFAFCAVLELSFLMAQDYTRYVDPHIGSDLSVEKGKGNVAKFIHHHLLISGGKLVLPSFSDREKMVDKHGNTLENSGKEKSTAFPHVVNNLWKTIPTQCIAHFVLNRQYRNWEVGVDSVSKPDTLVLKCNESVYLIPRRQVEEADGFCWDSPQKGRHLYVCDKHDNKGMQDGTLMRIATRASLPWVLGMQGHPLGIDWTLDFRP